ncbi:MAG: FliH/SctL family protein [Eubacteriales bacterium]|nr:FliH/SctL family protein [Lachnospiraceae bacterium]MDO5127824.1 FliH/SctL family protein [Eubacteriales bacterium]
MSNLIKSGFQNLNVTLGEPYIIDMNYREIKEDKSTKIIRSIDEKLAENELMDNQDNKEIINDALEKAEMLIADAKEQAAKLISEAELEAGAIKEQARIDGYEKGLEEGMDAAKQQVADHMYALEKKSTEELEKQKNDLFEEFLIAKQDMVDVSCGLIEKLTGILVDSYKPIMLHMINNALDSTESSKQFIIRVSNEIYPYVADNRDRIIGASNPGVSIEIFGDSKLSSGQCMIESDNGIVDLSMDVQVKNLITAIKLLSE